MITSINGFIEQKRIDAIIIECGGIGYEIFMPLTIIEKLPEEGNTVKLLTEFVVREESQVLYGFLHASERQLFRRLIKVSGIGAKTALAMMSALSIAEILQALSEEDSTKLAMTPGIGKKTADRLVVDFRGSLLLNMNTSTAEKSNTNDDVMQALTSLGYNKNETKKAMAHLEKTTSAVDDVASKVRAALRWLSGR